MNSPDNYYKGTQKDKEMHAMNKNLRKLTPGEILWCNRRAKGWTQTQAASWLDIPLKTYQRAERGECYLHSSLIKKWIAYPTGVVCALARRRSGLGMRGAAALLGLSHTTMLKMETESDPALCKLWRRQGFRF